MEKFQVPLYVSTHKTRAFANNVPRLSKQMNISDNILCCTQLCVC